MRIEGMTMIEEMAMMKDEMTTEEIMMIEENDEQKK